MEIFDRNLDLGPFVPGPDDDMLVCRCEEITKGEIRQAIHEGMAEFGYVSSKPSGCRRFQKSAQPVVVFKIGRFVQF